MQQSAQFRLKKMMGKHKMKQLLEQQRLDSINKLEQDRLNFTKGIKLVQNSQRGEAPENNWGSIGNPNKYLDVLPQPYRFINKCLTSMVLDKVWEEIKRIEEVKLKGDYEKNIPNAYPIIADPGILTNKELLAHRIGDT